MANKLAKRPECRFALVTKIPDYRFRSLISKPALNSNRRVQAFFTKCDFVAIIIEMHVQTIGSKCINVDDGSINFHFVFIIVNTFIFCVIIRFCLLF